MRVVIDARTWTADLWMAVEDHWRRNDHSVECAYVTHQRGAALKLAGRDRLVFEVSQEIREMDVPDPVEALKGLEERYGDLLLPLQRYLMSERFFKRRDRAWQVDQLVRHSLFLERLFDRFQPDLFVGDLPDLMPLWLAMDMAPAHGCEPVGVGASSFPPGRLLLLKGHREIRGAREAYIRMRRDGLDERQVGAARALQDIVLGTGTKVDYFPGRRKLLGFAQRLLFGDVVWQHLTGTGHRVRDKIRGNWYVQNDPIVYRLLQPTRALRARVADRRHLVGGMPEAPFVFYPLHFEPEAALLVHGSYFEDQISVVRNLARSLPAGWELALKEHPAMRSYRPIAYYRALESIPNVRLLSYTVPTNKVIERSELVAVVASTVGLEASAIGHPVLMFGDFPWDYAPSVAKVGRLEGLPSQIRELAESRLGPDHPDVLAFAASWDESLPPGRYFNHRDYDWLEPGNVAAIADAIRGRLELSDVTSNAGRTAATV